MAETETLITTLLQNDIVTPKLLAQVAQKNMHRTVRCPFLYRVTKQETKTTYTSF